MDLVAARGRSRAAKRVYPVKIPVLIRQSALIAELPDGDKYERESIPLLQLAQVVSPIGPVNKTLGTHVAPAEVLALMDDLIDVILAVQRRSDEE